MHEMISARHPFQGHSHYDTLRNMVTKAPNIDPRLSSPAGSAVKGFLIKNPRGRLCCKNGIDELKTQQPFFMSIDWDALYNRKIEMPYKPELQGVTDISSFETTFTKEAPIDSVVENQDGKSKSTRRGIMNFFGMGGSGNPGGEKVDADVFRGFSFNKVEEGGSALDGGAEGNKGN